MSKQFKGIVLSLSLLIVLFVVAGSLSVRASSDDGAYRQLGVYSEVLSRINSEYVEDPNLTVVTNGALHGLLESLDPNSSYMDPAEYKAFKAAKPQSTANIGATISKRYGYMAIVSVLPGGPADKAGLDNGDIIEALDGKSTRELSTAELQELLMGEKGSNVSFSVVRPRKVEPVKIVVTRDFVPEPSTQEKLLESGIGYLDPETLDKGKAQELAAKIKEAQHQGAKKFVLDLRNVSAGDLSEGVAVANLFLDRGTIASLKGQKFGKQDFNAIADKAVTKAPLIVLVNRGSAGPAEIVAAAIMENNRADVLGDKTFGNASVQKLIEMQDGSALLLSVAKYYTPSGKAIQDNPLQPNIFVPDVQESDLIPDDDDTGAQTTKPDDRSDFKKAQADRQKDQLERAVAALKAKG
jgi:carboxyl-terminal processing protease